MTDMSKKDQLYQLIRANPFISQQDLAAGLGLSRSAVAGHIAGLIRERRLLGRAYVLPDGRPVMCIGAANLDRKLRTLAPLQMGTSNPASAEEVFGGVARNIAENLARLGLPAALLTVLGDDAAGAALQAHAEAAGIDTRGSLRLAGTSSGTYTAVLDAGGEMVLALADMQLYEELTVSFLAGRRPQRGAAALTVADLNLPHDSVAALLADARHDGVPLVLVAVSQPKMNRLPLDLRGLYLLILNRGELETRVGHPLPDAAALQRACRAVQAQGALHVIVTCGGGGVYYSGADGIHHLPAPAAQSIDVTGAGDAFAAAACWSLYQDSADLRLACRRGLKLAAMTLESALTVSPLLAPGALDELGDADPAAAIPTLFQLD
ncbi:PfkB family carbohydrate kinase [Janthinobacterium fluminis]|uniref:PfkB family carbohydrate kinase n=1 Tax=Janthinobacterium fluminis TaxID=2987524 RepID=A0ABT5JWN3_9BURK|nr:PfkB family carbohydrate kinase [Janthinobacterium fluminis]MDC8757147.1 PfkB family carbohydrate kinase [Janthinobacterium fluminis]